MFLPGLLVQQNPAGASPTFCENSNNQSNAVSFSEIRIRCCLYPPPSFTASTAGYLYSHQNKSTVVSMSVSEVRVHLPYPPRPPRKAGGTNSGMAPTNVTRRFTFVYSTGLTATALTNYRERHGKTSSRGTIDSCSSPTPTVRTANANSPRD